MAAGANAWAWLAGREAGCAGTARIFLRGLALVYLTAFASFWVQAHGLVGEGGILPATDFFRLVREQAGAGAWRMIPSVFWIGSTDGWIHAWCALGVLASGAALAGVWMGPSLAAAWLLYLSVCGAGQVFFSFQWDALLLEMGLLALLLAPWGRREDVLAAEGPPRLAWWLVRWLLFRFMVAAGAVKLASGDPAWRDLTALTFHYETQPIPAWTSWHAHGMPPWFHTGSCAAMFVVELAVPFLLFGPRGGRRVAWVLLTGLQGVIAATGNYSFFNLLSVVLCLAAADDGVWPSAARRAGTVVARPGWLRLSVAAPVAVVSAGLGFVNLVRACGVRAAPLDAVAGPVADVVAPLRSFNHYGLFAVMTKERPEIVIEGSLDGVEWRAYEFRWKPGDLKRAPGFVAPHQPRLDWQMWFAALGRVDGNRWVVNVAARLLEGSPEVVRLMGLNPFPDGPPRWVRARLFRYRFASPEARRATGAWWVREEAGEYLPPVRLRAPGARL